VDVLPGAVLPSCSCSLTRSLQRLAALEALLSKPQTLATASTDVVAAATEAAQVREPCRCIAACAACMELPQRRLRVA